MITWEQIKDWYWRNGFRDAHAHMEEIIEKHEDTAEFLLAKLLAYSPGAI